MFGAFKAPKDELFYQEIDSDDWQLMNRNLIVSQIRDQAKFRKEMRFTMDRVMSGGASVLKSTEEKNTLLKGISLMGHSAVYNLSP